MDRYKWTLDYVESLDFDTLKFWASVVQHVQKQEQDQEMQIHQGWSKFFVELFSKVFGGK